MRMKRRILERKTTSMIDLFHPNDLNSDNTTAGEHYLFYLREIKIIMSNTLQVIPEAKLPLMDAMPPASIPPGTS